LEREHGADSPESRRYHAATIDGLCDRCCDLETRIAEMVATTAAGLAAQLRVAAVTYDCNEEGMELDRFIISALTAAERMAEAQS